VRLLTRVAEHADDLVLVSPLIGVHVALGGRNRAEVLGPPGGTHPRVDERDGRLLRRDGLARSAEAGDTGEQGERGGRALPRGVIDKPLADQLLDAGPADGVMALWPPGAEQVTDEQFRIERAAHREQLTGRVQELGVQRVGGRATTCLATSSALRAHPDSLSDLHM